MLLPSGRLLLPRAVASTACRSASASASASSSSGPPFRVLFFGTDEFSLATLSALDRERQRPQGCVSHLEVCVSPKGKKSSPSPVSAFAARQGLRTHEHPLEVAEVVETEFHLGVVASFGHLISKKIIEAFPRGILNVHGSLLPRWRGASPIPHAIMHGDEETGISIMEVKPHRFDVGCVLAVARIPVGNDVFRLELTAEMARLGARLMVEVLADLDKYEEGKWHQGEEGVTYGKKREKAANTKFDTRWQKLKDGAGKDDVALAVPPPPFNTREGIELLKDQDVLYSTAPLLNKRRLLRLRWSRLSAAAVWRRYRAVGDLGSFRAGVWRPTGEPVRLARMRDPSELAGLDLDARTVEAAVSASGPAPLPLPGRVLVVRRGRRERLLCVRCVDGWCAFERVFCGGRKGMTPLEFQNGFVSKVDDGEGVRFDEEQEDEEQVRGIQTPECNSMTP